MKNARFLRRLVATLTALTVAGVSVARLNATDPYDPMDETQAVSIEIGLLVYGIACSDSSFYPPGDLASCQNCCESSPIVQGNWWARYGCLLGCWSTFIPREAEV